MILEAETGNFPTILPDSDRADTRSRVNRDALQVVGVFVSILLELFSWGLPTYHHTREIGGEVETHFVQQALRPRAFDAFEPDRLT